MMAAFDMQPHPASPILLVEDDEIDVEFFRRALKKSGLLNPLVTAQDGVAALEMLRGEEGSEKLPQPAVLVVDINMPRMNGLELLAEIKSDAALTHSMVFILTTSARAQDRDSALGLKATGYFLKDNTSALVEAIKRLVSNEAG